MNKRTLISIISNRDPYFDGFLLSGTEKRGPLLALLEAENFDKIILLVQPFFKENGQKTRSVVARLYPDTEILTLDFNVSDPINYIDILNEQKRCVTKILRESKNEKFFINVSSGTPQMHAMWIFITASGFFLPKY